MVVGGADGTHGRKRVGMTLALFAY